MPQEYIGIRGARLQRTFLSLRMSFPYRENP